MGVCIGSIAKAWAHDAFKQRLLSDASEVFKEEGMEIPPGVEVRAVENTYLVFHLVLPEKPIAELTDEQLDTVAGGMEPPKCHIQIREIPVRERCMILKKAGIANPQ